MATNHTTNYSLNLWEPEDKFLRTEFNENSEKIDAALRALEQSKATTSTVSALQTSVTNLASQTDTRLTALASQTDTQLKALATQTSTQLAALATQTDTRLTALDNKSRFTKLKTGSFIVSAASTQIYEIDLTDIDWAAWDKVHLDMDTLNYTMVTMYFNEKVVASDYVFSVGSSITGIYHPRLTLYPAWQRTRRVTASFGPQLAISSTTFEQLNKLVFAGIFTSGTYTIYGET